MIREKGEKVLRIRITNKKKAKTFGGELRRLIALKQKVPLQFIAGK